ncbi:MAG: diguanylate cyclase [Pirellulales bacterium]
MSLEPRPLQVVVVSQQVPLLHEVSWILAAVGYNVQTTTDFDQDAPWRRYSNADFMIVDGRGVADPTAATFAQEADNPLYGIFLYDPTQQTEFSAWYAAGAHDALRTPVSRGELLARVRTGARFLEFERRLQNQSSRGAVPGMYSRRGLLRKLRKLAANDELGSSQHALLATAIDWFTGISRKSGETASHSLVNTAARAIKRATGENAVAAYFGDGRFATLLVGQSPTTAKCVAESLAKDFGCRESHHESIPRPTLTSAVVPWSAGASADRILTDALETLELAQHSGGGCVSLQGEFNQEFAKWKEEMSTGNPFVNVVAQDIMEPFPAVLERGAAQGELAEALRRSGIPVRPYVDGDGRLIGVVADDHVAGETRIGQASDSLVMPETINCDASFPEIYEAFSSRGCAALVVTSEDHPLGYLTCDGFLSMIDPIHAQTFAHSNKSADELAYLVVPSTVGGVAAEVASV